ncbi:hypothetical protein CHGG_09454 [Chaetomium globosum CBS 148.51]|uniref:Pyrroloquinoline quinone-dependent pyranose dehydrogenase beta-propeller domain-containing protein n=1 Tax=Chaetomium globosum (strain ATCC 6205 / CBS 148.51 / DSM 1962 / NBRC 6347 / NRRL 1970) TaxID=306901 RepID=Q2GRF0_CHAGB|nr:uncharacterized protein CHGG_09454 [Chaetomium globosum CBS 148.51]EAQ85440.1 hypothetical protein CHGG_09454 [Chaetomium globosum CBS 148.51]
MTYSQNPVLLQSVSCVPRSRTAFPPVLRLYQISGMTMLDLGLYQLNTYLRDMKNVVARSAVLGVFAAASVAHVQTECSNVLDPTYPVPIVASGWQAQLVAVNLTKPRSIVFDNAGGLLVVESGKGISRHMFIDNGGTCLVSDETRMVVEMPELNHGIALSEDGQELQTLFASTDTSVFSWTYNGGDGRVKSLRDSVVTDMYNKRLATRTLLMSKKQPGTLLVSKGGPETNVAGNQHYGLQIRAFEFTSVTRDFPLYSFLREDEGVVLGRGLRDSVGVAEHPVTGGIYAVENSAVVAKRNGKDVHENNPGEELNFLGYLNGTATATWNQSTHFGYPDCLAVWQVDEIPDNDGLAIGTQFATQENTTFRDETCAENYVPPRLTFPAHYAPTDIKFSSDGKTAYIAFHGSSDRSSTPRGYRLSSVAFNATTGEPIAAADSNDALTDVLTNQDLSDCPDNCFTPTGLAFDEQGRLWMSSEATGELYVLQRTGENGEGRFVLPVQGDDAGENGAGRLEGGDVVVLGWSVAVGLGFWLAVI